MGRDLLTVTYKGQETLLYPLLAARLAESLDVSAEDLPAGDELNEVVRRHLARSSPVQDVYRELRIIVGILDTISIPQPLAQLAKIRRFKLYVTTTFDFLMERAINEDRFGGQRQTLVFSHAPNDKQDLPREFDRLNRPTVFHLLGRFSGTPYSYAVTEEDTLEFLRSLQSKTEDSPSLLLHKLRNSNLLVLGSHLADWLTHFFISGTRGGRHIETEIEIDRHRRGNHGHVIFLRHFGGGARVFRGQGVSDFVEELYRRWMERKTSEDPEPPPGLSELAGSRAIPTGSVFLSYAHEDRSAAEVIRDSLDRAGVDVILVNDDSQIGDRWDRKLRSVLGECALFLPVISKRSLAAERRFFRTEWIEAILESAKSAPSEPFILPVAIDDTTPEPTALPEAFGALAWERLPGGEPSSKFIERVVECQRCYRRASFE